MIKHNLMKKIFNLNYIKYTLQNVLTYKKISLSKYMRMITHIINHVKDIRKKIFVIHLLLRTLKEMCVEVQIFGS